MIQALESEPGTISKLRSLKGKTVVFTGPLSIKREEAAILVFQAGGRVSNEVNARSNVLVVGGRSKNYRGGGNKGKKLNMALKVNRQHPERITILGEPDFRRLVRHSRLS
jgi:BRCT domain type II-containing protein